LISSATSQALKGAWSEQVMPRLQRELSVRVVAHKSPLPAGWQSRHIPLALDNTHGSYVSWVGMNGWLEW
jgi:hypothetical protein